MESIAMAPQYQQTTNCTKYRNIDETGNPHIFSKAAKYRTPNETARITANKTPNTAKYKTTNITPNKTELRYPHTNKSENPDNVLQLKPSNPNYRRKSPTKQTTQIKQTIQVFTVIKHRDLDRKSNFRNGIYTIKYTRRNCKIGEKT